MVARELVMYTRTLGCPFVTIARRVLAEHEVPYRELFIDRDEAARERVRAWTGFLSVPTLVIAEPGDTLPYAEPEPLSAGVSPRGVNRGSMLTEPNADQLLAWLAQHDLIAKSP